MKLINILKEIKVTNKPILKFISNGLFGEKIYYLIDLRVQCALDYIRQHNILIIPSKNKDKEIKSFLLKKRIPFKVGEGLFKVEEPQKYFHIMK